MLGATHVWQDGKRVRLWRNPPNEPLDLVLEAENGIEAILAGDHIIVSADHGEAHVYDELGNLRLHLKEQELARELGVQGSPARKNDRGSGYHISFYQGEDYNSYMTDDVAFSVGSAGKASVDLNTMAVTLEGYSLMGHMRKQARGATRLSKVGTAGGLALLVCLGAYAARRRRLDRHAL